jgi:Rad3-related DNA helicase
MSINLRPWQERVLNSIHDVGEDTTITINAPTGSGKTLLSLKIAEKLGADVIIVGVRTRTEQRRFWEDIQKFKLPYKPLVFFAKSEQCILNKEKEKVLEEIEDEKDITCEGCKFSNAPTDATEIFEEIKKKMKAKNERYDEDFDILMKIKDLKGVVIDYLDKVVDVFPDVSIEDYQKTLAKRLEVEKLCTYALAKNLSCYAAFANVRIALIGTYPYIFSFPSALFKRLYELPGKKRVVTIIDEAHNLDNLDFLERKISAKRLERVIKSVNGYCGKNVEGAILPDACKRVDIKKLTEIAKRFGERLNQLAKQYGLLDKKGVGVMNKKLCGKDTCNTQDIIELLSMLNDFAKEVVPIAEAEEKTLRRRVVSPFVDAVGMMNGLFEHMQGFAINPDEVPSIIPSWVVTPDIWYFYLTAEDNVSLTTKPISPRPIITHARRVFKGPWIIMSGTLFNREYIENVWGLKITQYFDLSKDKDATVGQLDVKIVNGVTSKFEERNDMMYQKYAKKIWEIVMSNGDGVYLVVYPNYRMMRIISDNLQPLLNGQVMQSNEEQVRDMKTLLDLARANRKLIFHAVAKGRFTEGIELTDSNKSLIKHVIVAGVPLPNIGDDYIQDRISASNYDETEWLSEHGRITTLQAIGRGIRYPDDSVTVWLLDYRYDQYAKKWGIKSRRRKIF